MKVYAVSWSQLDDVVVLIAASTPGRARYGGYLMCRDAYPNARLIEMKVKRAPAWDEYIREDHRDGRKMFMVDSFEPECVEYWGAPVRMR